MLDLIDGIIVMGYATSGAFFLRFWRATHDRLFLLFAISFFALCIQEVLQSLQPAGSEAIPFNFLLRLASFILIIVAIVDKNLKGKTA